MNTPDIIAVVAYTVAFVALVVFVVGYLVTSRGRALRTPEGRHMLHFRGSLALFMLNGAIYNAFGSYPGRAWVRTAIVIWFMASAIGGDWLMLRAQRQARRKAAAGR